MSSVSFLPTPHLIRRYIADSNFKEQDALPLPDRASLESPAPDSLDLRVLALNMWGLPVVARRLEERVAAICERIANSSYDIIALTELWHPRELEQVLEAGRRAGLRFHHTFRPGIGIPIWPKVRTRRGGSRSPTLTRRAQSHGTGITVLCRYPITSAYYYRYSPNGKPYKFHHADYVASKGAGLLRIRTPVGEVDVYPTHLHACYSKTQGRGDWDEYKATRVAQGYQLARFVQLTRRNNLCILLGDLNSRPYHRVIDLLRYMAGMHDAFVTSGAPEDKDGATFGAYNNSWGPNHCGVVKPEMRDIAAPRPKSKPSTSPTNRFTPSRIDYIMYSAQPVGIVDADAAAAASGGPLIPRERPRGSWSCAGCRVVRWHTPSGHSVSDHFGVEATFHFGPPSASPLHVKRKALTAAAPADATAAATAAEHEEADLDPDGSKTAELLRSCIDVIKLGRAEATRRKWSHLYRAYAVLALILLFCFSFIVGLPLSPIIPDAIEAVLLRVGPLLMVLATAAAITDLYLSIFAVEDELTSLHEVQEQMALMANTCRM